LSRLGINDVVLDHHTNFFGEVALIYSVPSASMIDNLELLFASVYAESALKLFRVGVDIRAGLRKDG